MPVGVVTAPQLQDVVPHVHPPHLVPSDTPDRQETPPRQQVIRVGPDRKRTAVRRRQLGQVRPDHAHRLSGRVERRPGDRSITLDHSRAVLATSSHATLLIKGALTTSPDW
jgi:hypothetical protein